MEPCFGCQFFIEAATVLIPPSYTISPVLCELLIKNVPHLVSFEANIHIEILRKNIRFVIADSWNSCLFSFDENRTRRAYGLQRSRHAM